MANKIFQRPKTVKEIRYADGSISKYNDAFGTAFLLFDPQNITSYECVKGVEKPPKKAAADDGTKEQAPNQAEGAEAQSEQDVETAYSQKLVYIKEKLACMWGNEEIEEYVLVDKEYKDIFASLCSKEVAFANKQDFVKAKVDDVIIEYSHKRGMFSRYHYNVWFEYADNYYYLYIKTCDGGKFKSLMEEFLTYKKTI